EIRSLHILRPDVFDAELALGLEEGDMDLVDPGLLDGRAEDAGDLDLIGAEGAAERQGEGGGAECAEADELATIDGRRAGIGCSHGRFSLLRLTLDGCGGQG